MITEGVLFGMGNPLLDISATVSLNLLKKYGLKENDAILAEEKHMPIYEEIVKDYQVEYIPGGATQNAIKVAQWIMQKKGACVFTGCIKDDHYGKILEESCTQIGVRTAYQYHEGTDGTGLCACLITGHNRSLVTNLAAACLFKEAHLDRPDIWSLVAAARIFYISAFFMTSCHPALMRVARHSLEHDKTFVLNLGAPFLVEFFHDQMTEAIGLADIVFGNETEALKMAEVRRWPTTEVAEIARLIADLPYEKGASKGGRMVVITQGADPILVVHGGLSRAVPVERLPDELIADTNGAGDAFVGGFLARLADGRGLDDCLKAGQYASKVVIQRAGCTFPAGPPACP